MARRSYRQYCGVARALDVLGERWTLLIVRDLLPGPRRFGDLATHLPGIGTDLLTARLRTLQDHGLVQRHHVGGVGGGVAYALTPDGEQLRPLIEELGRIGLRWLDPPTASSERFGLSWALGTVAQFLDPADVPDAPVVIQGSTERFVLGVVDDRVRVRYAATGDDPSAPHLAGTDLDLLAALSGHVPLTEGVTLSGDRGVARRWATAVRRAMPAELSA